MTQFTFASQLGHSYTLIVVMLHEYRGVALLVHSAKRNISFTRFYRDRVREIKIKRLVIKTRSVCFILIGVFLVFFQLI